MSAIIRKIVTVVEETHLEMGQNGCAADTAGGGDRRDRKSVCRPVCRGPLAADRDRRGTRRSAVEKGRGRARHRRRQGAELRQGGGGRRKRRTRTCGRDLASQDGRAGAQGAGQGRGADPVIEEAQRPGDDLDIPLGHKDAAFVRSHFDGMEVQINDAPRANEIMVAVAVTDSGRPLPRVGGLTVSEVKGEDGLR